MILDGTRNLIRYMKVVWNHRWYDYGYQLDMIDSMLKDCENHWAKDTHYLGATFTLGRIKVLRKNYRQYLDADTTLDEDVYLKKFLARYARNLHRLWD